MRRNKRTGVVVAFALVVAGCGAPPPPPSAARSADGRPLYETHGFVFQAHNSDPELCLGSVLESHPPRCEGIPMAGWDWDAVKGEEDAGGTIWGEYYLVGSYDGETFTVHKAGPPEPVEAAESDRIGTPCAEPAGGWVAPDPSRASLDHVVEAQAEVSDDPDFTGLWIDYYNEPPGGPTEEDPGDIILNVAFTGDLDRHERELRDLWGGPLCVTQVGKTLEELEEIQKNFDPAEFGLEGLWSDIDVKRGIVEIGVVVVDDETLQRIEERYGPGVVKIHARLKPVGPVSAKTPTAVDVTLISRVSMT